MKIQFPPSNKFINLGFSLVEVSIATGIAAMSIIMLFGLLPSGLNMFREANNVATSTQIAQKLISEAVQTDYDSLIQPNATGAFSTNNGVPRYFDNEGIEQLVSTDSVFHAYTRIVPSTSLPVSTAGNPALATITVQVVTNPNNQTITPPSSQTDYLIKPPATMKYQTYTSHIAKIK